MPNEYSWTCKNLEVLTSHNELTDVVCRVHWRYAATNPENPLVVVSTGGSTDLNITSVSPENFIPLSELTSSVVEEWVKSKLSEAYITSLNTLLDKMLSERINPLKRNVVLQN